MLWNLNFCLGLKPHSFGIKRSKLHLKPRWIDPTLRLDRSTTLCLRFEPQWIDPLVVWIDPQPFDLTWDHGGSIHPRVGSIRIDLIIKFYTVDQSTPRVGSIQTPLPPKVLLRAVTKNQYLFPLTPIILFNYHYLH